MLAKNATTLKKYCATLTAKKQKQEIQQQHICALLMQSAKKNLNLSNNKVFGQMSVEISKKK